MAPSTTDVRVTSYGATIPNDPNTDVYQQNATSIPTWTNNPQADDVPILEQLCGSRKKLRIAMLGAGVSGINFFKRAEEKLKHVDIVCYEKNGEVGGTWLENRLDLEALDRVHRLTTTPGTLAVPATFPVLCINFLGIGDHGRTIIPIPPRSGNTLGLWPTTTISSASTSSCDTRYWGSLGPMTMLSG